MGIIAIIITGFFAVNGFQFAALPPDCKFTGRTITTSQSGGIATCTSDRCISQFDIRVQQNNFQIQPWHVVIKTEIAAPVYSSERSCFNVGGDSGVIQAYVATTQTDLVKDQRVVYTGSAYSGSCSSGDSGTLSITKDATTTLNSYQCGQIVSACTTEGAARCSGNIAQLCSNGFWSDTESCPAGTSCSAAGSAWACVGTVTCSDGKKLGETSKCGTNGYKTCQWPGEYSNCVEPPVTQVCGNGQCEQPETYLNCAKDCVPATNLKEGWICNVNSQYKCDAGLFCDAPPLLNGVCRKINEAGCAAEGESVGGVGGLLEKKCCDQASDGITPLVKNKAKICVKGVPDSILLAMLSGVMFFLIIAWKLKGEQPVFQLGIALTVGVMVAWVVKWVIENIILVSFVGLVGGSLYLAVAGGLIAIAGPLFVIGKK